MAPGMYKYDVAQSVGLVSEESPNRIFLVPDMPRPRRKSSSLGSDLRGDTGVSALSTLEPTPSFASPPLTPVGPLLLRNSCLFFSNHSLVAIVTIQSIPAAFQKTESPQSLPALERPLLSPYMGQSTDSHPCPPRPLPHQSDVLQSPT